MNAFGIAGHRSAGERASEPLRVVGDWGPPAADYLAGVTARALALSGSRPTASRLHPWGGERRG
jgi:hypothetical protein